MLVVASVKKKVAQDEQVRSRGGGEPRRGARGGRESVDGERRALEQAKGVPLSVTSSSLRQAILRLGAADSHAGSARGRTLALIGRESVGKEETTNRTRATIGDRSRAMQSGRISAGR